MRGHAYFVALRWTGNTGAGTAEYQAYRRDYLVTGESAKPAIHGSSDAAFRGDPARWNPEELLVAALAACHQLWYLHLAASAGIVVTAYEDQAEGEMEETDDGAGRFHSVILRPKVTVATDADLARARSLHAAAHAKCFIANSVNFPVRLEPEVVPDGS